MIENKKEFEYIIYRNKIINVLFKGFDILTKDDRKIVKKILNQNKEMKIIIKQVIKFRNINNNRDEAYLKRMLKKWRESTIPLLKTFTRGIDDDLDAIINSTKHKETNGLAEGKINKLKTVKRMLYGKASSELLKGRLFLSDYFHSIE